MKRSVKVLWKLFIGFLGQEHNGVSFLKSMVNGIACFHVSMLGQKIWNKLMDFCIQEPDLEWLMIDATVIRAHPCAAGYKRDSQAEEVLGRSKGGFTCKIHALVDAL
jgi:hypothetical protein